MLEFWNAYHMHMIAGILFVASLSLLFMFWNRPRSTSPLDDPPHPPPGNESANAIKLLSFGKGKSADDVCVISPREIARRMVMSSSIEILNQLGVDFDKLPSWEKEAIRHKSEALARAIGGMTK